MAAVIPAKRCVVLASFILIFVIKKQQAISGTSAATYKVMEPHLKVVFLGKGSRWRFGPRATSALQE